MVSDWRALVLTVWIVAAVCAVVMLEDYGWTWRRLMKMSAWQVLLSGLAGIFLGLMLAPPLAATRPVPAPIVERVPIYTADVLDTGSVCVYAWEGTVFAWQWADIGAKADKKCPPKHEAESRWRQAIHAPMPVHSGKEER